MMGGIQEVDSTSTEYSDAAAGDTGKGEGECTQGTTGCPGLE